MRVDGKIVAIGQKSNKGRKPKIVSWDVNHVNGNDKVDGVL
jgi:hypothetical protein